MNATTTTTPTNAPAGMLIGYARTSTAEQQAGLQAQLEALKAAGCTKIYSEQLSATAMMRPQLEAALDKVREGDTFIVTKADRLARSTGDLLAIVKRLEREEVNLRILDFGGEPINTRGPQGRLMLTLFAAFAEFEKGLMLERQRVGIAKAKADGKFKGRAPTARRQADEIMKLHDAGKKPTQIARQLGIGRSSVFRVLKAKRETPPAE